MFDFVTYNADKLQIFLLVCFRAAGIFVASPVIGNKSVPKMIRLSMAIMLAMIMIPVAEQTTLPHIDSIWFLAGLALKEMLIGFIIGFIFAILFIGIRMAGNIIGFQIGLMIASIMDRETNSQVSIVSEVWFIVGILIFLAINGHHSIISAFADSYRIVPVGMFEITGPLVDNLIRFTAFSFTIAIKIAAPVMISLFMTTVVLGVVARTVPQMNIFIVGIPIKIGVGFLIMATTLPIFRNLMIYFVEYLDREVIAVIGSMATA